MNDSVLTTLVRLCTIDSAYGYSDDVGTATVVFNKASNTPLILMIKGCPLCDGLQYTPKQSVVVDVELVVCIN